MSAHFVTVFISNSHRTQCIEDGQIKVNECLKLLFFRKTNSNQERDCSKHADVGYERLREYIIFNYLPPFF